MEMADVRVRTKRNLIGFWLLGLCNNFANVIMLSAAHDILAKKNSTTHQKNFTGNSTYLECNRIGTAAILLADIIPSLIVKLAIPLYINLIGYRVKVLIVIGFAATSFLLVGLLDSIEYNILGVICASISGGLGEAVFLGLTAFFHRDVISAWSSGTGGAGLFGALAYAGLNQVGVKPQTSVLIMLSTTLLMAFSYFVLLKRPSKSELAELEAERQQLVLEDNTKQGFRLTPYQKLIILRSLLQYMIPLSLVYFAEYFINQGLTELLYFKNFWLSPQDQYRWYQVDYQIGVFISRSSVNLFHINKIWVLPILQLGNAVLLLCQVFFRFIPSFWIIVVLVLYEGLLGGAAYVNTFYKLYQDTDEHHREYSLSVVSVADSVGVCVAGAVAVPTHNAICGLHILI